PAVFHGDQAILDHLERHLVLNFFNLESRRRLVCNDESLDLVISDVAYPDDGEIAPRRIAYPFLLAIDDPDVALPFGRCCKAAGRTRTHQRLGQAEAADFFQAGHRWKPLLFLLFRAAQIDGTHGQPIVDAEKCGDRGVNPRHLHGHEAKQELASAFTPIAFHTEAADVQILEG